MNNLFVLLDGGAGTGGGTMESLLMLVLYIGIFGLGMYFLMIRPQKKADAKHNALL